MDTTFYIEFNIKTNNGFEPYGRFFVGYGRDFAYELFSSLKGIGEVTDKTVLNATLLEMVDNLPVNIKIIGCSLEEIQENCKIITREVFKLFNLRF